jgi:hypothetical protein
LVLLSAGFATGFVAGFADVFTGLRATVRLPGRAREG